MPTSTESTSSSPALAVAETYAALGQQTAHLMANAVVQQQQLAVTAQAAVTQGVMQIYSAASKASDAKKAAKNETAKAAASATKVAKASADKALDAAIESAKNASGDVTAISAAIAALANGLSAFNAVNHQAHMDLIKTAATAEILSQMIHSPGDSKVYVEMLETVKAL